MIRLLTFNPLDPVPSSFMNLFQDRAIAYLRASGATANEWVGAAVGGQGFYLQTSALMATATPFQIDTQMDWRDRTIWGNAWVFTDNTQRIGQANDHFLNDPAGLPYFVSFQGYVGRGAYSNVTTGASVSAGNPPLNAVGVFRSYAPILYNGGGTNLLRAFVDPVTGQFYLYNNVASPVGVILSVHVSPVTGLRP